MQCFHFRVLNERKALLTRVRRKLFEPYDVERPTGTQEDNPERPNSPPSTLGKISKVQCVIEINTVQESGYERKEEKVGKFDELEKTSFE